MLDGPVALVALLELFSFCRACCEDGFQAVQGFLGSVGEDGETGGGAPEGSRETCASLLPIPGLVWSGFFGGGVS